MRFSVFASLVLVATSTPPPNYIMLFEGFTEKYHRDYATEFEKGRRFQIFSENIDKIYAHDANNRSYTLGITAYTDRTFEEWRADHIIGFKPMLTASQNRTLFTAPKGFTPPDSVDWVANGGVTSVKDQGTCGSCWTFSTVGALEGAMFVAGRPLEDLSMQHILACDTGGNGCGGGMMDQAFDWVSQNGVTSLKDEPYLCQDSSSSECQHMSCPTNPPKLVLAVDDVITHTDVDATEGALEAAVAQQPVSVAIEADQSVFQHYTGGVLTSDACGSQLDHGVLVVGYGVDNGQKYWKVKNSWGTVFGEEGYIRIERGATTEGGECGIRQMASFPTIKKASSGEVIV